MRCHSMLALFCVFFLSAGCSSFHVGRPGPPPTPKVNVDQTTIELPQVMVMSKVETPLVVVVDPDRVPEYFPVDHDNIGYFEVHGIEALVSQHVPEAMADYFEHIEVVSPDEVDSYPGAILCHVQVDEVDAYSGPYGGPQAVGVMRWSLAIQVPDHDEFVYSFAANNRGQYPFSELRQTQIGFDSLVSTAVAQMMGSFIDGQMHGKLRAWEQGQEDAFDDHGGDDFSDIM